MWANDRQACIAIRKLLARVRLQRLWTEEGPTAEALTLHRNGGGAWSHGEIIIFRLAFVFWSGVDDLPFSEMLHVLDAGNLEAACSLAVAVSKGGQAVQDWIDG